MKVKICGLNPLRDVQLCINLKVDFMGFVFYHKSPRNLKLSEIKKLISKKFEVIGTYRRGSDTGLNNKLWRLNELGIKNQIQLEPLELNDSFSIQKIINRKDFGNGM